MAMGRSQQRTAGSTPPPHPCSSARPAFVNLTRCLAMSGFLVSPQVAHKYAEDDSVHAHALNYDTLMKMMIAWTRTHVHVLHVRRACFTHLTTD
mmetsp:Transcript_36071/g.95058  ORF Transcript_36071/g.95058 Transcript_36071/m.95058 type:complete len:94 (+) Transcript_36071:301-582(+)